MHLAELLFACGIPPTNHLHLFFPPFLKHQKSTFFGANFQTRLSPLFFTGPKSILCAFILQKSKSVTGFMPKNYFYFSPWTDFGYQAPFNLLPLTLNPTPLSEHFPLTVKTVRTLKQPNSDLETQNQCEIRFYYQKSRRKSLFRIGLAWNSADSGKKPLNS